jgi:UDP-N-acetylglucosamine--N-acetylmuramyl-(pentapeptide) pyrophosphoryl-undecaprenol N-acetylglucosamine transferase
MAPCGIGLGHITRMHPIAKELNARGFRTIFSTYLDGLAYARQYALPTFEAPPINFRVKNDGTIDFKLTAATSGFSLGIRTFLRQLVFEIRFMKLFKPDVVFSDSRASSLLASWLLRIPTILMLNQFRVEIMRRPSEKHLSMFDRFFFFIANMGWLFVRTAIQLVWGRSQAILIPDLPDPYTISLGNLAIPKRYNGKVKLIGPVVEAENVPSSNIRQLRKKLGLTRNRRVIYAAVSGPRIEREVLTKLLIAALAHAARKYEIIVSRGNPDGTSEAHKSEGLCIFDWIQNQDDYIMASDIVVSRAGHGTIMKSLVYGKPMILVPIPDHTEQYGNARRAESLNVARIIDQSKLNVSTLDVALNELLTNPEYSRNAKIVRKNVSSMQAIEIACDLVEHTAARA